MGLVVGLTGGIGSGKSAVAERFAWHGAAIVDTDAIAHQLTSAGGSAIEPIRAAFGPAVLTPEGALDRAEMRRRVFSNPADRARLEALLHPLIRAESENHLCRLANADFSYAVLVVPLLIETNDGYRERVDHVCVVDCPDEIRIARVMERSGLIREEVLAIMAAQAGRAARLAAADDVIDNGGNLTELAAQVAVSHELYLKKAALKSAAGQKMRFNSECGAIQG